MKAIVQDAYGSADALSLRVRRALTPHGTLVLVGGGHESHKVLGGMDRQLRAPLVSMFTSQRLRTVAGRERADDLEELGRLVESGAVTPIVDRTFTLAEAPDAIRYLAAGHAAGKVVITI